MTFEEYKKREEKKIETAKKFMEAGVEFEDIRTVYIADDVKIGKGTYIGPCQLPDRKSVV